MGEFGVGIIEGSLCFVCCASLFSEREREREREVFGGRENENPKTLKRLRFFFFFFLIWERLG